MIVDITNITTYHIIITYPANFIQINYEHFQQPIIFIIFLFKKLNIEYNNKYDC